MEKKKNKKKVFLPRADSVTMYSGASIDVADKEVVTQELVTERTKTLNNNPQNNGKLI